MIEAKFTKSQFENLLKLVSTATLVINSIREEVVKEFEELEQYLYSIAKEKNLTDLYDYDGDSKSFFPSETLEKEIDGYIDKYNQGIFWQTLCTSLAIRDLEKELGKSAVNKMELGERMERIVPIVERYADEFAENGIENLFLIRRS